MIRSVREEDEGALDDRDVFLLSGRDGRGVLLLFGSSLILSLVCFS